jgi:hypothetical protein
MWKKPVIILLLLSAFAMWGCPYESVVPIDEPSIPIDKGLFGKWMQQGEEKSYAALSKLSKSDSTSYRLVYNSWTSEHRSYEVKLFKAWFSRIKEHWFINIQPEMKSGGTFFICAIDCNNTQDTIRLRPISNDNAPKYTKSKDLRKWISKKMDQKDFFDQEEVFLRDK